MKQIVQNLKTGKMDIVDVPVPAVKKGYLLVRNHFSVISVGTEESKVRVAKKGYLGKAREKPAQVRMVLDSLKTDGFKTTYRKVMNKLDAWAPLGYSCAGVVIETGKGCHEFRDGDKVACGGSDLANHAEVVSVPENLAVRVPEGVDLADAAFCTVASIALQGIRQADLRLGESCAVIGLGLLGQLTIQMLRASGVKTAGIDLVKGRVHTALESGADLAFVRGCGFEERAILDMSGGYGVDAVIITAATSSLDPIEFSGRLCRKKGKVIITGNVPTGFQREVYYQKELSLKMATSYGPGRYEPNYEEKGLDYPIGYVRWTEKRNMKAFIQLILDRKLNLNLLTSHRFPFDKGLDAYKMILGGIESYLGILIEYDRKRQVTATTCDEKRCERVSAEKSIPEISFIGAGSFAQNSLLPFLKDYQKITVATSQGHSAGNAARKWRFPRATCNAEEAINDHSNTLFIATRHDLHADYVMKALGKGKNVFVEKPLCLDRQELAEIQNRYRNAPSKPVLMVGYNRRFAPHIQRIREHLHTQGPIAVNYRINAGFIPGGHWIQDLETGGGRIIGEVCHFLDLLLFLTGSEPKTLCVTGMTAPQNLWDTLNINLSFKNGSIANISYFANGSEMLSKERLEIFSSGTTFVLDDFKCLTMYTRRGKRRWRSARNKGYKNEVNAFLQAVQEGSASPIAFEQIVCSSRISFDVCNSLSSHQTLFYE